MGMPRMDMGALKSAESQALGQVEQKKREVFSQIDSQKDSAISQTSESIKGQINEYKGRKTSILGAISKIKSQLASIPDIPDPRAQEARSKLREQLKQMTDALNQINKAINMAGQQLNVQAGRIREQFQSQKEKVKSQLMEQKKSILATFAGKRMQMQAMMKQYQMRSGAIEAGRAKG